MTAAQLRALSDALARLAPPGAAVAAVPVSEPPPPLWPEEEEAVRGAVPARRLELACGRAAARAALAGLGCPACAIPQRPDRAPRWPAGYFGSIAHAGGAAVAVTVHAAASWGVGVDLEPAGAVEDALAAEVLRRDEAPPLETAGGLTAAFCAKEAAFKALSSRAGVILAFQDLRLDGMSATGFTAELCRPAGPLPAGLRLEGRWALAAGFQLALVPWPRTAEHSAPSFAASRVTS